MIMTEVQVHAPLRPTKFNRWAVGYVTTIRSSALRPAKKKKKKKKKEREKKQGSDVRRKERFFVCT